MKMLGLGIKRKEKTLKNGCKAMSQRMCEKRKEQKLATNKLTVNQYDYRICERIQNVTWNINFTGTLLPVTLRIWKKYKIQVPKFQRQLIQTLQESRNLEKRFHK